MPKILPLVSVVALLGLGGGALWWATHPTAPAEIPASETSPGTAEDEDEDTGTPRFETEEMMREIGYTQ